MFEGVSKCALGTIKLWTLALIVPDLPRLFLLFEYEVLARTVLFIITVASGIGEDQSILRWRLWEFGLTDLGEAPSGRLTR